jgi:simple sugar transport system ATP-binding protein
VLGIAGLLGSGRTELLSIIAGLEQADAGTITLDGVDVTGESWTGMLKRRLGMTPESRKDDGIVPLLGIDENTVMSDPKPVTSYGVLSARRIAAATRDVVRRMSVKAPKTTTPIGTLSGGNQQSRDRPLGVYAQLAAAAARRGDARRRCRGQSQIYAIIRTLAAEAKASSSCRARSRNCRRCATACWCCGRAHRRNSARPTSTRTHDSGQHRRPGALRKP